MNIKARRDYIDTHYIDGIKNAKGEYVIRPLNEEERNWLNKFYSEHVNASFTESNNVHNILNDEERLKIKEEIKEITTDLKIIQKELNDITLEVNALEESKLELNKTKGDLVNELNRLKNLDQKKLCYDANNARNRCLYNQSKKTGKLIKLNQRDYDDRTIKLLEGYDTEHIIIHDRDFDSEK